MSQILRVESWEFGDQDLDFLYVFRRCSPHKGQGSNACVSLAEAWHRPYVLYVSKILPSLLPEMGMDQNRFIGR